MELKGTLLELYGVVGTEYIRGETKKTHGMVWGEVYRSDFTQLTITCFIYPYPDSKISKLIRNNITYRGPRGVFIGDFMEGIIRVL